MHAAENALPAKIRAMYARRLTAEQFRDMLACRTAGEVAAYLKEKTPYGQYMEGMIPNAVHRGSLENRLREIQSRHLAALSRYAYAVHAPSYRLLLPEWEIGRLEQTLAHTAGCRAANLPAAPEFFVSRSGVNWTAVEQATEPAAVVQALVGSPYENACRGLVRSDNTVDMAALDQALRRCKSNQLLSLVQSAYDGAEQKAIEEQLRTEIDLDNLVVIYRTGVLRGLPAGAGVYLLEGGLLSEAQLKLLLAATDRRGFNEALSHTRYRDLTVQPEDYVELAVDRWRYAYCQRQLRFTANASVAMLSYASLRRLELKNILHLIEGVRYGAAESAAGMLIGVEK